MKLIKLILWIVEIVFNLIYEIIVLPFTVRKWHINKRWRKKAKGGDECYFDNYAGGKSWVKIREIRSSDKIGVNGDKFSTWIELEALKIR